MVLAKPQSSEPKSEVKSKTERQTGLEVVSFIGLPLLANFFGTPEKLNTKPILVVDTTPAVSFGKVTQFLIDFDEFASSPLSHSGRGGQQCAKGSTKTTTTSRINKNGRLMFVSETTSALAPGGDDPRRPPTPPTKPTPRPKLNLKRKNKSGKEKKNKYQRVETENRLQDEEVEIILLDTNEEDEVVVIPVVNADYSDISVSEAILPGPSGASLRVSSTSFCPATATGASKITRVSSFGSSSSDALEIVDIETSNSESSNGPEEVTFSTKVPMLRPYPGSDQNPRASNIPLLPHWQGLMWGTTRSGATNTCVMDSFFSHVIYLARRHPRYFRIHLNAARNSPETFILFLSQNTAGRTRYELSQGVHLGWHRSVALGTFQTRNGVVDMVGSRDEAVHSHLRQSDRIWLTHQCGCDISTREDIRQDHRTWTPLQIAALNAPVEDTLKLNSPRKAAKKCKQCKERFRYVRGLVSQATWFHVFNVPRTVTSRQGYPLSIEMQEIGTNAIVHMDLGYFSYTTRRLVAGVLHCVSVHHIPDEGFFFYNGMQEGGNLQPVPADIDQTHDLISVVYFRRYDETRPR